MKRYETYKDSGIDWLGEIPEHWDLLSFRFCIDILTDYTSNGSFASLAKNVNYLEEGYSRLVRLTDLRVNLENDGIYVSESAHNFLNKSELFGGEMLIANVGAYAGLVKIMPYLDGKFTLAPNMFLLRLNQNTDFFYYQLNAPFCAEQLKMMAISSAQPKLNKDNIRQLMVLKPSFEEQKSITQYLKNRTDKIDELITKKEQLIQLLEEERKAIINQAVTKGLNPDVPMKDSGIDWLGDIPEHWEVMRLKYILGSPLKYGANEPAVDDFTSNPRYIRITDFGNDGKLRKDTFKSLPMEKAQDYLLEQGDVLFARSGATVGKTFLFKDYNGKACFAGYLIKATCNPKLMNFNFLYAFTNSSGYEGWKDSISQSATIENIGADKYNQLKIAVPPMNEQNNIVEFLLRKEEQFEELTTKTVKEINLLKEYKTTLISEVVTGKIDVREEVLN